MHKQHFTVFYFLSLWLSAASSDYVFDKGRTKWEVHTSSHLAKQSNLLEWAILHTAILQCCSYKTFQLEYPVSMALCYRWFSQGVASLPEGKSRDLGLCSKCYIKSLPLVPKDKRSCFCQRERSAVLNEEESQLRSHWKSAVLLSLNRVFALRK